MVLETFIILLSFIILMKCVYIYLETIHTSTFFYDVSEFGFSLHYVYHYYIFH